MGDILIVRDEAKAVLALSGEWRVEQAVQLKEALAKAFGEFDSFDIDVSDLASADLSIVQVLRATGVAAMHLKMDMGLCGLGAQVSSALAGYGLLQGLQEVFAKGESVR